jgi:hypothetical protein
MQQGLHGGRTSAIGLNNLVAPERAVPARPGIRVAGGRVTTRRDPADSDHARMLRVMMQSVDKMMGRLGILATGSLPAL